MLPLKRMGNARKRVSRGGQSNPSPSRLARSRDEKESSVGWRVGQLRGDGGAGLLADAAVQHERFVSTLLERRNDLVEVFGPARKHEAVATRGDRFGDVVADGCRSLVVLDDVPENSLDVLAVFDRLMVGLVHGEIERA